MGSTGANAEILIDGHLYDVKKFRHPGGSIIKFFFQDRALNCEYPDASATWHAFHCRSERARNLLSSLPSRPYDPNSASNKKKSSSSRKNAIVAKQLALDQRLMNDFKKLEEDFRSEGYFDPSVGHVSYRLVELVALFAFSFWLMGQGFWGLGALMCGVAQGRCGWLMHEGGHVSLTGVRRVDILIQTFVYGVGDGMSAKFWRNQHNKHHATPQRLQHDVDLDTLPLVAFNARIARLAGPLAHVWLKLQAIVFPTFTPLLVGLFWQVFLHPRHSYRTKRYLELFCMVTRLVAVWYFFGHFGLATVAGMYLLCLWIGSVYIFVHFALSHTHKPVSESNHHVNWVRYAGDYTTNIEASWWCNWLMGYLNFQIEHHLFPTMPQFRISQITPRVRALFQKHGLNYDSCSYLTAVRRTLQNLQEVGNPNEQKHQKDQFRMNRG